MPSRVQIELLGEASPFSGMNPYLEGDLWMGFCGDLIVEIKRQLLPQLKHQYYPFSSRYELPYAEERLGGRIVRNRQYCVEIRDKPGRNLVTCVVLITDAAKLMPGRLAYLRKRQQIFRSPAHLVEIDLLRAGMRLPGSPPLPRSSNLILVSRMESRSVSEVVPVPLNKALPRVPIPLRPDEADAVLDLQLAFDRTYELGHYDSLMEYQEPLPGRLGPKATAWVHRLLVKRGVCS